MDTQLLEEWVKHFEAIGRHNREKLDSLEQLFDCFEKEHIESLPLKGMDLFLRGAYRSKGLRPSCDVDLLVRREDLPKIDALLQREGFTPRSYGGNILTKSFADESLDYFSVRDQLILDFIWSIWYLDSPKFYWDRCLERETPLGRKKLLHPEDALLYMIVYVVAHRGNLSSLFVQDLEAFLKCEGNLIEWTRWSQEVKHLRLATPVYHGLKYACEKGLVLIPSQVLEELTPRSLSERGLLWSYSKIVQEKRKVGLYSYLLTWVGAPTWRAKGKLLRRAFLPSREFVELRQGKTSLWKRFLAGIVRPFRILVRSFFIIPKELVRFFLG